MAQATEEYPAPLETGTSDSRRLADQGAAVYRAPHSDSDLVDLVSAVQRGDHAAFSELYDRFEGTILALAMLLTRNSNDAFDVCQQTWLTVFEKLGTLHAPERFPGWVTTTARRHALDVLRVRGRVQIMDANELGSHFDSSETAQEIVEREETSVMVRRGLALLAPERARVLIELVCNERSYRDAAEKLGRPIGSLGPSRARYLRQLAQNLDLETIPAV
jgi:RNA polymerase sigma factor (sigma-70 family)